MSMRDEGTCPIHLPHRCAEGCDYWAKSDANERKRAEGLCIYLGCQSAAASGDLCAVHSLAAKRNWLL